MPIILNIDTATEYASVCISRNGHAPEIISSEDQKNHASFVQPAIATLTEKLGIALSGIDAVAVTAGPGSYTGLRVGMASAKGICYALQKPLILVNTLEVMAQAVLNRAANEIPAGARICPMIDARRMEVFTALFNQQLAVLEEPHALILEPGQFDNLLTAGPIIFCGSGMPKLRGILTHPHALYSEVPHDAADLAICAAKRFDSSAFSDLAYSEPLYVKEFFSPPPRKAN